MAVNVLKYIESKQCVLLVLIVRMLHEYSVVELFTMNRS